MSHLKDRHYWTQLRAALTAGQWTAQFPAKTPNGTLLSWSELLRKFNKHCTGFKDVAEVVSQTRALALLLSENAKNDDEDDTSEELPLQLGRECLLPEERIEEAREGYRVLKDLRSSNFNTINFALAYYAYALGNPSECLSHLTSVADVLEVQNHIPSQGSNRSSTMTLQVPGVSAEPSISSASDSIASDSSVSLVEIKDGRGWAMTETFRSICLQGMSLEQLSPSSPKAALKSYNTALPLLTTALSELKLSISVDYALFTQLHELWRWVERLIWRGVVLSAQSHQDDSGEQEGELLWAWLDHYTKCSTYWPATFRTAHRSTISTLYLRALVLRYSGPSSASLSPFKEEDDSTIKNGNGKRLQQQQPWVHTARGVVQDYRAILSASTQFPRAGERNTRVEEFVDLCVAVWEASGGVGEHTGWVIDILWWATRLTFNSFRVLRHMTRLLYVSGDTSLAKRTLGLYVQVVGKAHQANEGKGGEDTDADEDRKWVETLVCGVRMLCKSASMVPGLPGVEDVREAGRLVQQARSRLDQEDQELSASVDLAEGVWNSVMALKEQDPHTRPARLEAAHALFLKSVETYPTHAAYFHLALSFARPGPTQDLTRATDIAAAALEGDAKEIRYWHLLGLLLAATERWSAAQEILEKAADIDETQEVGGGEEGTEESGLSTPGDDGSMETSRTLPLPVPAHGIGMLGGLVESSDSAEKLNGHESRNGNGNGISHSSQNGSSEGGTESEVTGSVPTPLPRTPISASLLSQDGRKIPRAATLLKSALDHSPPSGQDKFEYALQLRMTQVVLTENVEGAEGAAAKWLEIFQWIAEKKSAAGEVLPRTSTDGSRLSGEINSKAPSVMSRSHSPGPGREKGFIHSLNPLTSSSSNGHPLPIPITISPATPDAMTDRHSRPSLDKKGQHGRRSQSTERGDTSKSKKLQMFKNQVNKGQAKITTISRKIGNGVVRNGSLRRANSTPDFHAVLRQTSYQASSIHSRRRLTSFIHHPYDRTPNQSPPPPPPPPAPPLPSQQSTTKANSRLARENRLLSDLWLMSAATFRRQGKIEQAKGAIQEAEVKDESNPAVWVQLGLYYNALGHHQHAIDAFQKALFILPDDVSASVHLSRLWLSPEGSTKTEPSASGNNEANPDNVDLAAGMLSHLTRGAGWDVPEAWYFLAKAYGMQGRKDRERECLSFALELSESRGIREIGTAIGWCI